MPDTELPPVQPGAPVSLADIEAARRVIGDRVRHTPLLRKDQLSIISGQPVYLKGEHLQRTGSFKLRGAINKIASLTAAQRTAGVVAASAGNHAQGVAVAAREFNISAQIFMPADATLSKVEATRGYGAQVSLVGANLSEALVHAKAFASEHGATFIHPFDDAHIIAGQGTLGMEILADLPDIGTLIVPVGGGGLASGIATAVKAIRPECRVIAVQAAACPSLSMSLAAGHPVDVVAQPTMADGIAVKQPGELTLGILARYVDQVVEVDDDLISSAMLWLIERAKQVVEGAGAVSLAALLSGKADIAGPTVCLLSGGNIDSMNLFPVIRQGLTGAGRFVTLSTRLDDRPGALSQLLALLATTRVNVLSVEHRREGIHLHVDEALVDLTLQTRNHAHVDEVVDALAGAGYRVEVTRSALH